MCSLQPGQVEGPFGVNMTREMARAGRNSYGAQKHDPSHDTVLPGRADASCEVLPASGAVRSAKEAAKQKEGPVVASPRLAGDKMHLRSLTYMLEKLARLEVLVEQAHRPHNSGVVTNLCFPVSA